MTSPDPYDATMLAAVYNDLRERQGLAGRITPAEMATRLQEAEIVAGCWTADLPEVIEIDPADMNTLDEMFGPDLGAAS